MMTFPKVNHYTDTTFIVVKIVKPFHPILIISHSPGSSEKFPLSQPLSWDPLDLRKSELEIQELMSSTVRAMGILLKL